MNRLMLTAVGVLIVATMVTTSAGQGPPSLRSFTSAANLEESSETSANVSMGDLDGDGDLDLVLAKGRHWPLLDRVLLNDGKGKFVISDIGQKPDRTYSAVLADVDGDRDLDLLVSNDKPDTKLVYLNDGKAHFHISGAWGAPDWSTRNAAVADLNGDGRPDVIAANRPGPSFVCLNDGRGRFDNRPCIKIAAESATSIVPADFDKDGFREAAKMFCSSCGTALSRPTKYCNRCGAQLVVTKDPGEIELRKSAFVGKWSIYSGLPSSALG